MNTIEKNLKDMSTVLELQRRVAEVAEENRKKVTGLQAKFEKVQNQGHLTNVLYVIRTYP